jgi:hypothetical protein
MRNFVKIETHENLIRDISTHAIIQDSSKIEEYKFRRNIFAKKEETLLKQKEEIDDIRAEMKEIKQMLLNLMQR